MKKIIIIVILILTGTTSFAQNFLDSVQNSEQPSYCHSSFSEESNNSGRSSGAQTGVIKINVKAGDKEIKQAADKSDNDNWDTSRILRILHDILKILREMINHHGKYEPGSPSNVDSNSSGSENTSSTATTVGSSSDSSSQSDNSSSADNGSNAGDSESKSEGTASNKSNLERTNWGFKGFPSTGQVYTAQSEDDIQALIDKAIGEGGGTVQIAAGDFSVGSLKLGNKIRLIGAGREKTKLHGVIRAERLEDVVIKNLTLDCKGPLQGIELSYGSCNVLVENVEVYGADRSNIGAWNPDNVLADTPSRYITIRNCYSHNASQYHGITLRGAYSVKVVNCKCENNNGQDFDFSTSKFIEMANCTANGAGYDLMKIPRSDYVYVHDCVFSGCTNESSFKIARHNWKDATHLHLENNTFKNGKTGIRDWSLGGTPTLAELVLKNNKFINIQNTPLIHIQSSARTLIFGSTDFAQGIGVNYETYPADAKPEDYGAGYKSWPNP